MARRGEPYWTDVRVGLEILEPGSTSPRLVALPRPFGIIGRLADSDVHFDDRAVSARHAYLHADARGLFVVDLASRNGLRFDGNPGSSGWVLPGETFEIAERLIRVTSIDDGGRRLSPPPIDVNLLDDSGDVPLCEVSLEPVGRRGVSWTIGSELIFVGRDDSCGIRLNQANVARTHVALFRDPSRVYLISFPGQPTLINGRIVRDVVSLEDGDAITIGQARFTARIFIPSQSRELDLIHPPDLTRHAHLLAINDLGGLPGLDGQPSPLDLIPPESREAVLGWMLGTLHAGQAEILRRQDELQRSVALILQHLQADTAKRLDTQADRIEALAGELSRLASRESQTSSQNHLSLPHLPPEEPRRPARDLPPAPAIDPAKSFETAAWLLEQIDRVGSDNKFSFRSLLSRRPSRKPDDPRPPGSHPSTQSTGSGSDQSGGTDGP